MQPFDVRPRTEPTFAVDADVPTAVPCDEGEATSSSVMMEMRGARWFLGFARA